MPPIVLTGLQVLLLVLLYLFVARAVRAVIRDVVAPPQLFSTPPTPGGQRSTAEQAVPTELVVHLPQGRPRVIPLDSHDVTFGRAETSTVVLADQFVSDAHARIYWADGTWLVTDLGSTNGTYVNQRKVTAPVPLAPGDQIGIGKTTVQVRR